MPKSIHEYKVVVGGGMERGFLSHKGSRVGRGVKEKNLNRNKECVTPFVVEMTVEKDKLSPLNDTNVMGSFPPLSTLGTTTADNAPGKFSYANITRNTSGKKVNVRTLFTPGGNGINVVVLVDSIRAISERFANTAYGFFLGKKVAYPVVASYNNPLILKKWHPDENLLKEDVSTVPVWVKLHGVPVTAFSEDGLSAIAIKLELRADVKLKDNIVVAMPKITKDGPLYIEKKTVKKPSQTSRGVSVGPKMGFKPQKEYRHVFKKTTASSSGNKKKGVEPIIEVSNSNPFDVLNPVDNEGEFSSNTPIGEKIDKIKRQIYEGKLRLLDDDGNPLVPTGIVESDSEVRVVFDETANLRISMSGKDGSDKGYGTNSLLEQ
nr:hypothetical protein [Tanacetum cinerariifolium]